ncbi:MAG: LytTR family transcriptional regulator [Oscillospiraceae bacterium]|nr:LytTR family transcriptional regulator [Oscillospiraceae bacterium]
MQIKIEIDPSVTEPRVIVLTGRMTDEVNDILRRLSEESPQMIAGFREEEVHLLEQSQLYRVYAEGGKVYGVTKDSAYVLRLRLYELEERLDGRQFVRISHSEIVNLKMVKSFDLSFAGTICVTLRDGTVTYVSRRYVSKIKKILGL